MCVWEDKIRSHLKSEVNANFTSSNGAIFPIDKDIEFEKTFQGSRYY